MATLTIKRGDLEPSLISTLSLGVDAAGAPITLATATGVSCRIRDKAQVRAPFGGAGVIEDATTNVVSYAFVDGDTDVNDTYSVEWVIDWGGSRLQTVPGSGFQTFKVVEGLANDDEV